MSRVVSNNNVSRVENIIAYSAAPSLATVCAIALASIAASAVADIFNGNVNLSTAKLKKENLSLIKSTKTCHKQLTTLYTDNIRLDAQFSKNTISNYKTAFIKSLSCSDFRINNREIIEDSITGVMHSKTVKEFHNKVDDLVAKIERQHTGIIRNELSTKIREASIKIGFSDIKIIRDSVTCSVFTTENKVGQALVHELHVDQKTNQINHIYEYVDNRDNNCDTENGLCEITANKFQKALENKGVFFSSNEKKPTGGNAVLSFSKQVKKQLVQKRKSIEAQRVRKLNKKGNLNKI